ncbi:N-acetyltransferase [Paenibacillaceae bacterium]|nr:N-acetyltransferase [Paenibacillaceae bacterium]
MLTIKKLTRTDWKAYSSLMFRWLLPQLDGLEAQNKLLMIGAETAGEPIGLIVMELEREHANVHCLFVAKSSRRQGIAAGMMRAAKAYCLAGGLSFIQFAYYANKSATAAIEAWLHKEGWSTPRVEAVVFHIDSSIASAPWLRDRPLPHRLRMQRWSETGQHERDQLSEGGRLAYPAFLSPFKAFAPLEEASSLCLLSASGIEGWVMAYRVAEHTILYDAVFVAAQYQRFGLAFVMLAKSILLQLEVGIPYGMFTVNASTPDMMKLARQWIAPYACKTNEKKSSFHKLK